MKRSEMFIKTSKNAPSDEVSKNAQLLIRAGYVSKEMAGVYAYLPLGLKVIDKIKQIVREEMDVIGGQELIMTNLQSREVWESTTRWSDDVVDIWFKTKLKDETELGLAWSHEEPIVKMLRSYIESYKDLPVAIYQFQTKLRNELRAKSGIMRGREFVMKDLYSFHTDEGDLNVFYNTCVDSYKKVFERLGIGEDTYITFAGGGDFTDFSHEFQTICEAGEDAIYLNREKKIAVNEEIIESKNVVGELKKLGLAKGDLEKVKTAEVGNIFNFGTEKTDTMGLYYTDAEGKRQSIWMGSYGIGITRVMGVIAEKMSDEKGLVWPENIAPAKVYLIGIERDVEGLYKKFVQNGIEVIWDNREVRPGEKFADADLLGIPYRVVVSEKLGENEVEVKPRTSDKVEVSKIDDFIKKLK